MLSLRHSATSESSSHYWPLLRGWPSSLEIKNVLGYWPLYGGSLFDIQRYLPIQLVSIPTLWTSRSRLVASFMAFATLVSHTPFN